MSALLEFPTISAERCRRVRSFPRPCRSSADQSGCSAFVALSEEAAAAIAKDPKESDRLIASIKKFVADKKVHRSSLRLLTPADALR